MSIVIHAAWCARYKDDDADCDCGTHERYLASKRRVRMEKIDALAPDIRELVHEYGWSVVNACLDMGVTKANRIRHIVETVLDEFSPTRSTFSSQGRNTRQVMDMTRARLESQNEDKQ